MRETSIEMLNESVADEMAAVHQYFHFHCDDQGLDLLAYLFKQFAIEEMMHVERLAERILFLSGEVEMMAAGEVSKIHDVKKMLETAIAMELRSALAYNKAANQCLQSADSVTRKFLKTL